MSSLYYTYFVRGAEREIIHELPPEVEERIKTVLQDFRSVGPGEWVGSSELAEMALQHDFRHAFEGVVTSGLIWLSPVDLGRDQRWATEELTARFDRVRALLDLEPGTN